MSIKGDVKNIALTPTGYKDLNPEETFMPYQIDLRNGYLTDAGNWSKRNGYDEWRDIGFTKSIDCLIPSGVGYAVTEEGNVFKLSTTPTEYTGQRLLGLYRPIWTNYNGLPIICDGGNPVKIEGSDTALLEGSPPNARFVDIISNYCIMSGHSSTEFMWSASGNAENWSTGDSGFANVKLDGDRIRHQKIKGEKVFFWKDNAIEVWYNRGGATPFVRLNELWIDKGCGADYSVIEANNTFYWFGNDGDFYILNGNTPQVISKPYRSYFDDKLKNSSDLYGYDFRKENCIRWFSPVDGICIKYDYLKGLMSEDNAWYRGHFARMPINSYMELNNEQYFGDYDPTGKVYHWSKDYKDDNGEPIRVFRKFKVKLSEKGHNTSVNRLRLSFKRGVATNSIPNPKVLIRWRFDESPYWKTMQEIDLGTKQDKSPFVDLYRLGMGKEIELEITETDAVDYLLKDILLTSDEKGN